MKYLQYIIASVLILGALYSIAGIGYFKWINHKAVTPKADFLTIKNQEEKVVLVDFLSYSCGYCKSMHPIIKETLNLNKGVTHVTRPIIIMADENAENKQETAALEKLVLAAGLQGRFDEFHNAFMEYPNGIIPESFIQETAALYGLDYDKLTQDAEGEEVQKLLDENVKVMIGMGIQTIPAYIVNGDIYTVQEDLPNLQEFLTIIQTAEQ